MEHTETHDIALPAHKGPERPTFMERITGALRVPYLLGCLLLALLLGPPGNILFRYVHTGDFAEAISAYFRGMEPAGPWQHAAALALWTLIPFYCLWAIRYVRLKVLAAEDALAPILPEGQASFRRIFRYLTHPLPSLAITTLLSIAFLDFITALLSGSAGPVETVYQVLRIPVLFLILGTALWMYVGTLWNIYALGKQPLRLKPYYVDGMLGVRPFGALSLSVSFAYFGQLGLLALVILVSPVLPHFTVLMIGLVPLGMALFFLPLDSVHRQMLAERGRQRAAVHQRLTALATARGNPAESAAENSLAGLRDAVIDLKNLLVLEATERRVAGIPAWPFDLDMLRGLATIVIPVVIAIVTQAVLNALGL